MTVVSRNESKRIITIPRGKNVIMSYQDTLVEMEAYLDGQLEKPRTGQETQADTTEPTTSNAVRVSEDENTDATENSSSFGDTISRNEATSVGSDAEVESEFRADIDLFGGFSSAFPTRRKKLTNHWRNFIRPLMWRCKWTELKIRELESQALKYTRELEANEQPKTLEPQQNTSDCGSKLSKPMKRRKRIRVENVTDITSYISQHHLFSYFENKKPDADGAATSEDDGNQERYSKNDESVMVDDWLKSGEDSIEQILRQIETVQSKVHNLRNHLDMVMLKNGVKLSSSENLSLLVPYDVQTSAAQSPTFSVGNGDNMSLGANYAPQRLLEIKSEEVVLPESISSGYAHDAQIPDIIESNVGMLSGANVTTHQLQIMDSGENILDETQMQSKVKQEADMSHAEPIDSVARDVKLLKQSTSKCRLTSTVLPTNKRKRGERKAAPGGWNLKCAGEIDSN
ncbi:hypothetical protein RND81_05G128500 [Saponaria officinalis]|uniref:Uncharacterized protein n=1 Tax=Saponaria officinalis TaxID=3572 RepID=A0AAW1KXY1_SAPOF